MSVKVGFLSSQDLSFIKANRQTVNAVKGTDKTKGSDIVFQDENDQYKSMSLADFVKDKSDIRNFKKAFISLEMKNGNSVMIPMEKLDRESLYQALSQAYSKGTSNLSKNELTDVKSKAKNIMKYMQKQVKQDTQANRLAKFKAFTLMDKSSMTTLKKTLLNFPELTRELSSAASSTRPSLVFKGHDGQIHKTSMKGYIRNTERKKDQMHLKQDVNFIAFKVGNRPVVLDFGTIGSNTDTDLREAIQGLIARVEASSDPDKTAIIKTLQQVLTEQTIQESREDIEVIESYLGANFNQLQIDNKKELYAQKDMMHAIERNLLKLDGKDDARFVFRDPQTDEVRSISHEEYDKNRMHYAAIFDENNGYVVANGDDGKPYVLEIDKMNLVSNGSLSKDKINAKIWNINKRISVKGDAKNVDNVFSRLTRDDTIQRLGSNYEGRELYDNPILSKALLTAALAPDPMVVFPDGKGGYDEISVSDFLRNPEAYGKVPSDGYLVMKDDAGKTTLAKMERYTYNNADANYLNANDIKEALTDLKIPLSPELEADFKANNQAIAALREKKERSAQQQKMFEKFSNTSSPQNTKYIENSPISVKHWQKKLDLVGKWVRDIADKDLDVQGKIYENWKAINNILKESEHGIVNQDQIEQLRGLVDNSARLAQAVYEEEAAYYENLSDWYSVGLKTAEITRDAAANTVNAVADAVPAIKPIAMGMNAALTFIDTVGSGGSYEMAAVNIVVNEVLNQLPGGEGVVDELKMALGKAVAASVMDMLNALDRGEEVNAEAFIESFKANIFGEGSSVVIGKLAKNPAMVAALETLAGQVYDIFLAGD